MWERILRSIGYNGSILLFILTLFLLPTKTLVLAYILGNILNMSINALLKEWIAEPRPSNEYQHIDVFGKIHEKKVDELGFHEYGMPSGHAQSIWFTVVFVWYVLRNPHLLFVFVCLAIFTSVQRIVLKGHTWEQVFAGSILGGGLGFLTYRYRRLCDITR